jgi:hypothetical protein
MLIPRGSLDAFTSRAATHLGLPYDIVAYPGITLVDLNAHGISFIRGAPGMASRFFLVRAVHLSVPPLPLPSFLFRVDREPERGCCNLTM